MTAHPDLVILGGEVLVLDQAFSVVEALAVTDGMISALGDDKTIRSLAGRDTKVVELSGGSVLPGINDSHVHACAFGLSRPPLCLDLTFPAVSSISDVVRAVSSAASTSQAGTWIQGTGWDTGYLDECRADPERQPHRSDLDGVAPNHPVFLQDFSGHVIWVNSCALALAGIDSTTAPPDGGVITKTQDGEPTGLFAHGGQDLVARLLPVLDAKRREDGILSAVSILNEQGVTSFTEPGLGPGGTGAFGGAMSTESLDAYVKLVKDNRLSARVNVLWLPSGMSNASAEDFRNSLGLIPDLSQLDARRLSLIGVKVFADGTPPSKTSWMYEDFEGGGRGSLCVHGSTDAARVEELHEIISLAHQAGYQVGVHVTGDRAIDNVVEAFAEAARQHPRPDPRHYVIHGDFVSTRSLETMAQYGVSVNMNPAIKWSAGDLMAPIIGEGRSNYQWPARSAIDAGVRVMSSSDAPVTYPNWRQGVASLMLRESRSSGRPMGPEQCIGLEDALRAYTTNAAWQDFSESWKGSLEVGMIADICVLNGALLHTEPHEIPNLDVILTVVEGKFVYEKLP
ncbi:MAG: amidohydrolase [Acidimicrobiales bacterium]